ncbi:MAG: tetratricopeptide repeat protein [Anaerolineales bacterium]|nr:tetratricopeptide repeat protein [Anaerolineales bacterium]
MTASAGTRTIIEAKLSIPRLPNDLVLRPDVARMLEVSRAQVVMLLCAPAGYGKTTTVAVWLRSQMAQTPATVNAPTGLVAWYSVDEDDDQLFTFVTYLVAAIERVLPGACSQVTAGLHGVDMPSPSHLAALLLADLAQMSQRLTLVLDDFHHIHAPAIHALLAAVVRHPPPLLHLVVIARTVPALPLGRLRAANQLMEFGASQLAFTPPEIGQLLENVFGHAADAATVASLYAKTEGWVAGLRLLMLVAKTNDDRACCIPEVERRSQHLLFDYLMQEVLANLPDRILTFLLESSILTTLHPALCDTVCSSCAGEVDSSAALLQQLVQHNLFITEIGEQDGWYRYHPQFQACLAKQLRLARPPASIKQLYARAAGWYGEHGYITESMQAYLAADMQSHAADQLEQSLVELYRREEIQLLQHLVGLLPPALVKVRPALLMLQCWLAELHSQWAIMGKCTEDAARLLESSATSINPALVQTVWGEIHAARSYYLVSDASLAEQQASAEQALALLPADHVQGRGFALINLARIYRWQGRLREAEDLLERALDTQGLRPDALTLRLLNALTLHYIYTLQLDQAERAGEIYLTLAGESGLKLSQNLAHALLGIMACMRNQIEQADSHFAANAADLQAVRTALLLAQVYLYILLVGNRDPDHRRTVTAALERLQRFALQHGSAEMLRTVEALQAFAALQRGDKRSALPWAHARPFPPVIPGKPLESLIWVRCKLADGSPAALQEAQEALAQLAAITAEYHDAAFHLEVQALQSLLAHAQGREAESLRLLRPVVRLAAAQSTPFVFIEQGHTMTGLLRRLATEPTLNRPVRMILEAIGNGAATAAVTYPPASPEIGGLAVPHYEKLTPRELQILELLARRLSNDEIAASLVVSTHTVRNHLANLYAKLGVASRRAAVVEAQGLGVLPKAATPDEP